jgi:hypothetical protein
MRIIQIQINTFLFFLIIFTGCEEFHNKSSFQDVFVLQGYLYQDKPVSGIQLTKILPFESEDTIFINIPDADVYIEWEGQQFHLEADSSGLYNYPFDDLKIIERNSYLITITYEGKTLSAETTVPERPAGLTLSADTIFINDSLTPWQMREQENNSIEVTWENPDNDYFYVTVENLEENPESIDIGFVPPQGMSNFRYLSQPYKTDMYILGFLSSIQQYGKHKIKVYRVNEEYACLFENREQDSRYLTEPYTNVKNGIGIFTAFSYAEASFEVIKQ